MGDRHYVRNAIGEFAHTPGGGKMDHMIRSLAGHSASHDEAAAKAAAAEAVAAAKAAEPELTKVVTQVAARHGGKLEGLDFRLKSEESLSRKLMAEVAESTPPPPMTATLAAAKMFDVNRYTAVHSAARYADEVQASLDTLRAEGYTLKVKNYWNVKDNPYKGVNVQVTSPSGRKFELQFHTSDSLSVKEGELHAIYEKQRVETNRAKREAYDRQMFDASAKIRDPHGVEHVH